MPRESHRMVSLIISTIVPAVSVECGLTCAVLQASTALFVAIPLRIKVLSRVRVL